MTIIFNLPKEGTINRIVVHKLERTLKKKFGIHSTIWIDKLDIAQSEESKCLNVQISAEMNISEENLYKLLSKIES